MSEKKDVSCQEAVRDAIRVAKSAAQEAQLRADKAKQAVHLTIQKHMALHLMNDVVEYMSKQELRRKGLELLRMAYLDSN
jgi:hypothetical protein